MKSQPHPERHIYGNNIIRNMKSKQNKVKELYIIQNLNLHGGFRATIEGIIACLDVENVKFNTHSGMVTVARFYMNPAEYPKLDYLMRLRGLITGPMRDVCICKDCQERM